MSDDDIDEDIKDTDEDLEEDDEFAEPDLEDEDDLVDEPIDEDDDGEFAADLPADDDEEEEDPVAVVPDKPKGAAGRARTGEDKDEEDDDELDPDDVEADLDTILKDRLEAYDEGDDEEEEEVAVLVTEEGDLPQKREGEFPCPSCFLIVNVRQVARTGYCPHCGDPIQVPAALS